MFVKYKTQPITYTSKIAITNLSKYVLYGLIATKRKKDCTWKSKSVITFMNF